MHPVPEPREGGTVLILGAGASYGSTVTEPPPLMKNFIKKGRSGIGNRYDKLWKYLEAIGFPLEALDNGEPNLEELYSRLHIVSMGLWHSDEKELFKDLGGRDWVAPPISFLESFIIESTNIPSLNALKRPCRRHDELVRSLQMGDSIVSFNYDLIIDASVSNVSKWSEVGGYGFYYPKLLEENEAGDLEWRESDVLLLKPHGSLNWFLERSVRYHPEKDRNNILPMVRQKSLQERLLKLDAESTPKIGVRKLRGIDSATFAGTSTPDLQAFFERLIDATPDEERWHLPSIGEMSQEGPFIIPPTVYKFSGLGFPQELSEVWQKVRHALVNAGKIVSIGYSFPTTDLHFDTLFRLAMRDNGFNELCLQIVDPSIETFQRIRTSYPNLRTEHVARTLEEYVRSVV